MAIGVGIIGLLVVAVVVMIVSWVASREGGILLLFAFGGLGLVALLGIAGMFLLNVRVDQGVTEKESVSANDDSITYERKVTVSRGERGATDKPNSDIDPVPSSGGKADTSPSEVSIELEERTSDETPKPAWMQEGADLDSSSAVVSEGPRPTKQECRELIGQNVAMQVIVYAADNDMRSLLGKPNLLPRELLEDVVREEHFVTSPHEFNGEQQTWYTLYQLLEFDGEVHSQLQELNNHVVLSKRLIVTGVGAGCVFGLLGIAFLLLKSGGSGTPGSKATGETAERQFGFQNAEEASDKGSVVASVAIAVVLLVGIMWAMG